MPDTTRLDFGGIRFEDYIPDEQGNVPFRDLGSIGGQHVNLLCALERGRSYTPDFHKVPALVVVLEGTGQFYLKGEIFPYKRGSSFTVPAGARHGFVSVYTDTLLIKQVPAGPSDKSTDSASS